RTVSLLVRGHLGKDPILCPQFRKTRGLLAAKPGAGQSFCGAEGIRSPQASLPAALMPTINIQVAPRSAAPAPLLRKGAIRLNLAANHEMRGSSGNRSTVQPSFAGVPRR